MVATGDAERGRRARVAFSLSFSSRIQVSAAKAEARAACFWARKRSDNAGSGNLGRLVTSGGLRGVLDGGRRRRRRRRRGSRRGGPARRCRGRPVGTGCPGGGRSPSRG